MARPKPQPQARLPGFDTDFATPTEADDESLNSDEPPASPPNVSFVARVGERTKASGDTPRGFTARVRSRKSQPTLFEAPQSDDDGPSETASPTPTGEPAAMQGGSLTETVVHDEDTHSPTSPPTRAPPAAAPQIASGEKAKARDLIAAIRTLQAIERGQRYATVDEQETLAKFPGFGPVALRLFPDPVTGQYKDASWQTLGDELQSLLTPDEYASAKRTTFNAFYTSPVVIQAIHDALPRFGVPANAHILEPGCGSGNFLAMAPQTMHFTGVELDSLSARITKARHPQHDIRIEDFRDTKLPKDLDAVVGNVPFADVRYEYHGQKLALHDYFLAKSLDALAPGGIVAVVTTHYTLDKLNAAAREALGNQADFLGAIRLPSDAFRNEGTSVVTDGACTESCVRGG